MICLVVFLCFISFSLFLSQFPSPYPVVQTGGQEPLAPLPSAYSNIGPPFFSSYYSPLPHHQPLPLTPHAALPSIPTLGTPQTPVCIPQHVSAVPCDSAIPIPPLSMAMPPAMPQQQGFPPISQPNLGIIHSTHPVPLPQLHPFPYLSPQPEQKRAEQPVQVNI